MHELKPYIELIKNGDVVAFPTETVYGLGADAWNPTAISKVFKIKGRPADNPLIVHVSDKEQVSQFASEISSRAELLMDQFWPGPLTLVFPKKPNVLDAITAGLDSVAVRMPDHKVALEFIRQTGPLVAPSANTSGMPSPTKADHVRTDFGINFPVVEGGATSIGLESTVLDLRPPTPTILRPGKIGPIELQEVLHEDIAISDHVESTDQPHSPGQKYTHYKPKAEVRYGAVDHIEENTLYLLQTKVYGDPSRVIHYQGDLELLSRELYDRFRQADRMGLAQIWIEDIAPYRQKSPSLALALSNRIEKSLSE